MVSNITRHGGAKAPPCVAKSVNGRILRIRLRRRAIPFWDRTTGGWSQRWIGSGILPVRHDDPRRNEDQQFLAAIADLVAPEQRSEKRDLVEVGDA
jgi:hypothetical protein